MTPSKLFKITLISSLAAITSVNAHSNELDLRISNDWVHTNFTVSHPKSKSAFGLGYFYKDEDESINVANIDLHAKGQTAIGNLPTTVGIGFEGTYFKSGETKGSAVGIGGTVRVNLPDTPGLSIETALHYAPDVLSFSDADEFRRLRAHVNYRIIENADISIGYKYINVGIAESDQNVTLESGAFLGFKLNL